MDKPIVNVNTKRVEKYIDNILKGFVDIGTDGLAQDFTEFTLAVQYVLSKASDLYLNAEDFTLALKVLLENCDAELDNNGFDKTIDDIMNL